MLSLMNVGVARAIQADRLREAETRREAHRASRERRARRRDKALQAEASRRVEPQPKAWVPPVTALTRLAGSASAVRVGSTIEVGATAATASDGSVLFPGDPYLQTREALRAIGTSLKGFGVGLEDVVRTRVFLKKAWQWEEAGRAHGEAFEAYEGTQPVTTFVGAGGFVDSNMLVAVEATAVAKGGFR